MKRLATWTSDKASSLVSPQKILAGSPAAIFYHFYLQGKPDSRLGKFLYWLGEPRMVGPVSEEALFRYLPYGLVLLDVFGMGGFWGVNIGLFSMAHVIVNWLAERQKPKEDRQYQNPSDFIVDLLKYLIPSALLTATFYGFTLIQMDFIFAPLIYFVLNALIHIALNNAEISGKLPSWIPTLLRLRKQKVFVFNFAGTLVAPDGTGSVPLHVVRGLAQLLLRGDRVVILSGLSLGEFHQKHLLEGLRDQLTDLIPRQKQNVFRRLMNRFIHWDLLSRVDRVLERKFDAYLDVSETRYVVKRIENELRLVIDKRFSTGIPEDDKERIKRAFKRAFDSDSLKKLIKVAILEEHNSALLIKLLPMLSSASVDEYFEEFEDAADGVRFYTRLRTRPFGDRSISVGVRQPIVDQVNAELDREEKPILARAEPGGEQFIIAVPVLQEPSGDFVLINKSRGIHHLINRGYRGMAVVGYSRNGIIDKVLFDLELPSHVRYRKFSVGPQVKSSSWEEGHNGLDPSGLIDPSE